MFETALANRIAERNNGRFFQTLGVEYFAWPVAAVLARNIVNIDVPLVVVGRTSKSWGTNMVLMNPGEGKINQFVSDAHTERQYTPLTNFTFNNLAIEGLLTAAAAFPEEFVPYPVDLGGYVRETRAELERRAEQNVDVSSEMEELDEYAAAHPELSTTPGPGARCRDTRHSPVGRSGSCAATGSCPKRSTPVTSTASPTRSAPRSSWLHAATERSRCECRASTCRAGPLERAESTRFDRRVIQPRFSCRGGPSPESADRRPTRR